MKECIWYILQVYIAYVLHYKRNMFGRLALGSWSQDLDMMMVGMLYCTYITSWVGSTAAMTSQRGFMREEAVNFRSAAQQRSEHRQQQQPAWSSQKLPLRSQAVRELRRGSPW